MAKGASYTEISKNAKKVNFEKFGHKVFVNSVCDLQKAFDTINHDFILKQMSSVGFSFQFVTWFELYLSNRRFQVSVKSKHSDIANINNGIHKDLS